MQLFIITLNLVAATLVFSMAARIYVLPQLDRWSFRQIMVPILLLHSTRHYGMMFLAQGATYPGIPRRFTVPAAYGDLIAAVLAFVALLAVVRNLPAGRGLVWIFNIEGSLDLIVAIALATVYRAAPFMGPAYWIPAFWVPALLVTHYITFIVLGRKRERAR